MSMSGMTESVSTAGMLMLVLVIRDDAFAKMYPSEKCPTANVFILLAL